jgi:uncharacterized hydantoinase/oxoprolinase family protein
MGPREFLAPAAGKEIPMPGVEEPDEAVYIACIQELDELVDRKLRRYPLDAIVVAMGTCLAGMLGALLEESQCTPDDIRELLREIESEIFPPQGPAKE